MGGKRQAKIQRIQSLNRAKVIELLIATLTNPICVKKRRAEKLFPFDVGGFTAFLDTKEGRSRFSDSWGQTRENG